MKKKILKIILAIVILFAVCSAVWFGWSRNKYGRYSGGMKEAPFSNFISPHYIYTDDNKYDYLVRYPDFLSLTGNLSVGLPSKKDEVFTDALIIWPKMSGEYELGVLLYDEDGTSYSVYINQEGNALSEEDGDAVSRHSDNIRELLDAADERWDIID